MRALNEETRNLRKPTVSRVLSEVALVTVIYLGAGLLRHSSSLPESHDGSDQSCFPIWPCSRWGLPSQPVTRLLVGSYIKELALPRHFTLTGKSP